MDARLNNLIAHEHASDLQRQFGDRRVVDAGPAPREPMTSITLRRCEPADAGALAELAELDSSTALSGEVLLALAGDRLVAAIAVDDGRVIASPFEDTAEAVALLGVSAAQRRGRPVRWRDRLTLKLRPA